MDIFERASRSALRFPSAVGLLMTEQLWGLPLTNDRGGPSLDLLARGVYSELKGRDEVSFVDEKPDPRRVTLQLQLDILKHVIASKKADRDAAVRRAETIQRKQRLMAALEAKQGEELAGMSRAEIEAEIAKLGAGDAPSEAA